MNETDGVIILKKDKISQDLTKFSSQNLVKDFKFSLQSNSIIKKNFWEIKKKNFLGITSIEHKSKYDDMILRNIYDNMSGLDLLSSNIEPVRNGIGCIASNIEEECNENALIAYNKQLESINNWSNGSLKVMKNEYEQIINDNKKVIDELNNSLREKDEKINELITFGNKALEERTEQFQKELAIENKINEKLRNKQKLLENKEKAELKIINEKYKCLEEENFSNEEKIRLLENKVLDYAVLICQKEEEEEITLLEWQKLVSQYKQISNKEAISSLQNKALTIELNDKERKLLSKDSFIEDYKERVFNLHQEKHNLLGDLTITEDKRIKLSQDLIALQANLTQITQEKDNWKKSYEESKLDLKIQEKELNKLNKLNTKSKIKLATLSTLSAIKPLIPFKWYENSLSAFSATVLVNELTNYPNLERITWVSVFASIASSVVYSSFKVTKYFVIRGISLFRNRFPNKQKEIITINRDEIEDVDK